MKFHETGAAGDIDGARAFAADLLEHAKHAEHDPGQSLIDAHLANGMVAFNAAFGDVLYPADEKSASRRRIVDEMTAFMVHGTAHRPQT